jgi:hypothetical protein
MPPRLHADMRAQRKIMRARPDSRAASGDPADGI